MQRFFLSSVSHIGRCVTLIHSIFFTQFLSGDAARKKYPLLLWLFFITTTQHSHIHHLLLRIPDGAVFGSPFIQHPFAVQFIQQCFTFFSSVAG